MAEPATNKILNMEAVRRITGLPSSTAYLLLQQGLPHFRWGRSIRVLEEDLVAFMERHKVGSHPAISSQDTDLPVSS